MSTANCELAFYGQIAEGFLLQEVKENVAELFKAGPDQVERMFTGKRVVIRNKLDLATAEKYVAALKKRGAICQIEKMGMPGEQVSSTPEPVTPAPSSAETSVTDTAAQEPAPVSATPSPVASSVDAETSERAPEASDPYATEEVKRATPGRPEAMPLAGLRADEILADANLDLDPVGIRLSETEEVDAPDLSNLDVLSLAPVGTDIGEKKEHIPPVLPDVSHLSLVPLPETET